MASAAQLTANHANAQNSTGPRTVEGRQRSSVNRLRHGLTSTQIILPGEDAAEYDELREDLLGTYKPANATECTLVEEIAASSWRLMRARRQETIILTRLLGDCADAGTAIAELFLEKPKELARLMRYITSFERAYYRALNKLEKLQKERRAEERQAGIDPMELDMADDFDSIGFVSKFQEPLVTALHTLNPEKNSALISSSSPPHSAAL
jgi:hypothetical protein